MAKRKPPDDKLRDMEAASQFDCWMKFGVLPSARTIWYPTAPEMEQGEDAVNEGVVNTMTTRIFIKGLMFLKQFSKPGDKITIIMNCWGGDEYQGFAVYDAIRNLDASGYPVTIYTQGVSMSMGVYILQAARTGHRILAPSTRLLLHEGTWGIPHHMHSRDSKLTADEFEGLRIKYNEVLYAPVAALHPEYNREQFYDKISREWYMSAQEGVALGLADRIE